MPTRRCELVRAWCSRLTVLFLLLFTGSSAFAQFFTSAPIFQFDIFYNLNLEISLSSANYVDINGPVYCNAGIWVGSPTVNFSSTVSAVDPVITNITDPFQAGKTYSGVLRKNCFLPGQPVTGLSPLSLPVFGTTNAKAMLNLPPAGLGAPNVAAYAPSNQVYLYNAVDLIISNAANNLTNIQVYYQNPANTPAVIQLQPDVTNVVKYFSFAGNATFYDFRETATNFAVQLDVAKFKAWLTNTTATGGNMWNNNNLASKGHGIDSIYIYNSAPFSGTKLPSVRLINGGQMPSSYGLTVVTPQPVYVLGNYNVQTNDSGVPNSLNVSNTVCTYPAAIMADAITVLSTNWSDAYVSTNVSTRPATNTTINAALLAGIVPSTMPTNGIYSGGVDNFIRLEENWSGTGIALTHNGATAALFASQYATNPWATAGIFYNPPVRYWAFDTNFWNPSRLPPLTPILLPNTNPPVIVVPPPNQQIASGNNALFGVQALGALPFTYQWSFNGATMARATNASLAFTNVQDAQGGGYTVQVSNRFGSAYSPTGYLNVMHDAPVVFTNPASQTVVAHGNAMFNVYAWGSLPMQFQWFFSGAAIGGATNGQLTLTNVLPGQAENYWVQVTNIFGFATSATATLTVIGYPPTISTEPVNQSVAAGSDAAFSIVAGGSSPLSYQWTFNEATISGATNSTLTLLAGQPVQSGNYFVQVTNAFGSVTSTIAVLTVTGAPPVISLQPVNHSVFLGSTVSFAMVASGLSPFGYQWNFNGADLPGATNSVLTLTNVQIGQAGSYFVMVTNLLAATNSATVTLSVSTNLLLALPVTVNKSDGILTNAGCVSLSAPSTTGLVVSLVSSDPARLALTNTVIILPGQTNGFFDLGITNYAVEDGPQTVTVDASAAGCADAIGAMTILDNGADHFTISALPSPEFSGAPQNLTIGAVYTTGALSTNYQGVLTLSAAGDAGSLTVSPAVLSNFVAGQWLGSVVFTPPGSNVVLTASDGHGHPGISNPFDVISAGLDHFDWSPIATIQTSTVPFGVTITAKDRYNQAFTGFNRSVALTALMSPTNATVGNNIISGFTLLNTHYPIVRNQVMYLASELNGAATFTGLAIHVTTLPRQALSNWTIRMQPTALAGYSNSLADTWAADGWTTVYQNNETLANTGWVKFSFPSPFYYDGTNNLMIDFSFANLSVSAVGGVAHMTSMRNFRTLYAYVTYPPLDDPLTWSGSSPTPLLLYTVPDIQLFTAGGPISVSPANSDNFVNGAWTGTITAMPPAANVILQADDGNGHVGFSTPFRIMIEPPVILSQPADQSVVAGSTTIFSVTAIGTPPLSYQWQLNGTNLVGATSALLKLDNVIPDQAGVYSVQVANLTDSVLSSNASLSVIPSSIPFIKAPAFFNDGSFQFQVYGVPGSQYVVAVSTNLVDWVPVNTNPSPFNFADTNAPAQQRFYRVISAQ